MEWPDLKLPPLNLWNYPSPWRYTMQDPVVEAVRSKLAFRASVGMSKYGTDMARKDVDLLGWMNHLQEELMDAAVYLERVIWDLEDDAN